MPPRRFEDFTADQLEGLMGRLETAAGRLQEIVSYMKERGVKKLPIHSAAEMKRGISKVEAFISAAEQSKNDHRLGG